MTSEQHPAGYTPHESELHKQHFHEQKSHAVNAACAIFGFDGVELRLLLFKRAREPFEGKWELPGGRLSHDESAENCIKRELHDTLGLSPKLLRQVQTFSNHPDNPDGKGITVLFYKLINPEKFSGIIFKGGEKYSDAQWFVLNRPIRKEFMYFDHLDLVSAFVEKLKIDLRHFPVAFELLDEQFTIKQLQTVYEEILNKKFDRANFHKKMVGISDRPEPRQEFFYNTMRLEMHRIYPNERVAAAKRGDESESPGELRKNRGILIDTGEVVKGVRHKPAKIYMFDRARWDELMKKGGFTFDF